MDPNSEESQQQGQNNQSAGQQHPGGYPPQSGYPPQGGFPPQGGYPPQMYPPSGGFAAPSQPAGYGAGGAGYPPQQPYGYPGGQQNFPSYNAPMGNPSQTQGFQEQPASTSGTMVELCVTANGLKGADKLSKSDPVCVLFEKRRERWEEIGRTEMIENDHNPRWQTSLMLISDPESTQDLKFEVFDWDSKSASLNKQDVLGQAETTLSNILSDPRKQYTSSLTNGAGGTITVLAEQVNPNARERVQLQLMGTKLDSKDLLGKSDPYFNLMKDMSNGLWSLVYTSEVIKNNENPEWNGMEKPITEICNGDYDRDLKIEVLDYDSSGENDLIGEFTTNLQSLSMAKDSGTKYELINPKKEKSKRKYKNSGYVSVVHFQSK